MAFCNKMKGDKILSCIQTEA